MNDTQDHLIWFSSIDSTTISWNTVINEFCLNLRKLFTVGKAVHKFFLCCVCTYQRATMYGSQKSHYPRLKCHKNEEKIDNDCVLRNYHTIKTAQPISMILVLFFSEDNVYLMKSKYAIFLNIKVTKIERSAFLGTPDIYKTETKCVGCKIDFAHHKTKCFITYTQLHSIHVCLAKILYKIILPHKMWDHLKNRK